MGPSQKTLVKWTEPRAYAKDRAARNRAGWSIWQRFAFGYAMGTIILATALMRVISGRDTLVQPLLEWIGIWFCAGLSFSLFFWALAYLPERRTIWMRKNRLASGKRSIAWDSVAAFSQREAPEFMVILIRRKDGRIFEYGAERHDLEKIEAFLKDLGIPVDLTAPEASTVSGRVTLKFAGVVLVWTAGLLVGLGIFGSAFRYGAREVNREADNRAQMGFEIMARLKDLGVSKEERREIAKAINVILLPKPWEGTAPALMIFGFGGMIVWTLLLFCLSKRRAEQRGVRFFETRIALGLLLAGICGFAVVVGIERRWEETVSAQKAEALDTVTAALAKIEMNDSELKAMLVRLRRFPTPTYVSDTRSIIYANGVLWLAVWILGVRLLKQKSPGQTGA